MVDLRSVLDRYRIPWRDRGPNTSAGNVNVPCPWCAGQDTGFHLAISEIGKGYYCWRNSRHAGKQLSFLFKALHIPFDAIDPKDLRAPQEPVSAAQQSTKQYDLWSFFAAADADLESLDYLRARGFSMPQKVCKQFGIRVDKQGGWSGRLLVPLTVGWTGRAMRPGMQPRYDSETDETGFFDHSDQKHTSALIFEGPLDAMRAASMSHQFAVKATLGKRMSPSFLYGLRERRYKSLYIVLDNDVPSYEFFYFQRYLNSFCTSATVNLINPPNHVKDLCDLSEEDTLQWLSAIGSNRNADLFSHLGQARGRLGPQTT